MSLQIDRDCRTVTLNGVTIRPTKQQFNIIAYLSENPGHVRTRPQIMYATDPRENSDPRAIDVHLKRIRKLGITNIKTSWGVGYYWED